MSASGHKDILQRLQPLLDEAMHDYSVRVHDSIDYSVFQGDLVRMTPLVARALMDKGDVRAFQLGKRLLEIIEGAEGDPGRDLEIVRSPGSQVLFHPLVQDPEYGLRLHRNDLAVNKVIAAASRSKARDFVDLASIVENYCPLGPLLLAAAGKPPHLSPGRMLEELRRRITTMPRDDLLSVRGFPADISAEDIRSRIMQALEGAEHYLDAAPMEFTGRLVLKDTKPVEALAVDAPGIEIRRPTDGGEPVPEVIDEAQDWRPPQP